MDDPSTAEHRAWLAELGRPALSLTPLAGDVSRRAYSRVHHGDGTTTVLAVYPPEIRDVCRRFARTGEMLAAVGVRAPRIEARDCRGGRMLLEDAGDRTLYDERQAPWSELAPWVERAADLADRIGEIAAAPLAELNPPLDGELLARELRQTWDLLLIPRRLAGEGATRQRLRAALAEICARLDAEPRRACHRDFMARNLVPAARKLRGLPPTEALIVLDHQDLRLGPAAYDLASLLNDSLFCPPELEARLVDEHLGGHRRLFAGDPRRSYRRCVVQRALKACGTYAAFAARGADRHLPLVAPTLRRAADNLARIPEGRGLDEVVERWRSSVDPPPR